MKNFQDFLNALREDEALRFEAKRALNSDSLKVTEEQYAAVVAFGKDHGFEFTEEDIHLYRATNRTLDEQELELVTGGGGSDYCACDDSGNCDYNWFCYNDHFCDDNQYTEHGGKGHCILDYACSQTWNTCTSSNQCEQETKCQGSAY